MSLETITFYSNEKGIDIAVYTDAYSYNLSEYIALLSVCGPDSSVKAVSASVMTNSSVTLENGTFLTRAPGDKYRILSNRFESGLLHQIVISELFFSAISSENNYLYIENRDKFYHSFFLKLKQIYTVPLIPGWSKWIYDMMLQEELIERLEGNVPVLNITASEDALEKIVTEGVKSGAITF